MLVLTRRPGESILIDIPDDLDPSTPVSALFADGPIEIRVISHKASTIRIGIDASNGPGYPQIGACGVADASLGVEAGMTLRDRAEFSGIPNRENPPRGGF